MSQIEKGQSLFEILFAFVIMSLIVVAIVGLATISIRNSSYSRNRTLAEKYATEAVDWLRQERDGGWTQFADRALSGKYCLVGLNWNISRSCEENESIAGTVLYRTVELLGLDNKIEAEVVVSWNDAKGLHEIKLSTLFSNWKPVNE